MDSRFDILWTRVSARRKMKVQQLVNYGSLDGIVFRPRLFIWIDENHRISMSSLPERPAAHIGGQAILPIDSDTPVFQT